MSSRFGNYGRYGEDDIDRSRGTEYEPYQERSNRSSNDFDRDQDRSGSRFRSDRNRTHSGLQNREFNRGSSQDYPTGYGGEYETGRGHSDRYGREGSGYNERTEDYRQPRTRRQYYERDSSLSQHGGNYQPNFEAGDAAFGSYESLLRDRPDARPYGSRVDRYSQERDYSSYPSRDRSRRQSGGSRHERGWWDRVSDELSSWFGDENAERRRRMDEAGASHRGKGPRGYKRSDERIREDINERLTDYEYLDARDVDVSVNECVVTLSGTVDSRWAKRAAEGVVDTVSGVEDIHNNLRVGRSAGLIDTGTATTATDSTTTTDKARSKTAGT